MGYRESWDPKLLIIPIVTIHSRCPGVPVSLFLSMAMSPTLPPPPHLLMVPPWWLFSFMCFAWGINIPVLRSSSACSWKTIYKVEEANQMPWEGHKVPARVCFPTAAESSPAASGGHREGDQQRLSPRPTSALEAGHDLPWLLPAQLPAKDPLTPGIADHSGRRPPAWAGPQP